MLNVILKLFACWVNFYALLSSAGFFSKSAFSKNSFRTLSVSNGLDPDPDLLVLIWVQTVYKGYQQMTKVTTSKKRVKHF